MMKEIKDFFKTWTNVGRDDRSLKSTLFRYYIENEFIFYLHPATQLILSARLSHREFEIITYSSLLASIETKGPSFVLSLINYLPFINSLTIQRKKYIYDYVLRNSDFWNIKKDEIEQSLLNRVINSETITSKP